MLVEKYKIASDVKELKCNFTFDDKITIIPWSVMNAVHLEKQIKV